MNLTLPVVTSAALLDSINPCAISVLLLTLGFLISLEKSRKEVMGIAGVYILAIFFTYILIGLGVLSALTFFNIPRAISKFGAIILFTTGIINLIGLYWPKFPIKLQIPQFSKSHIAKTMHRATIPAAALMGILVGLFEFPCTGGPYLLILTLLHDSATFYSGFLYLIYYNLIFVLPLIVILLLANSHPVLAKIKSWRKSSSRNLELISSLLMILLSLIIIIL